MFKTFGLLAVAASLLVGVAAAQEKAPLPIATIDVAHIFKHYKPVAEKLAPLRADLQELEQTIQLRQVEIDTITRKLQTGGAGDDRDKLQLQLSKLQIELRQFVEKERQSIARRELAIQTDVYRLINAEVAKIAKERGLKLVLVRPRGSLESQDIGEVTRTLNQLVMFEDGLDITDEVLKGLDDKPIPEEKKPEPKPDDEKEDDEKKDAK